MNNIKTFSDISDILIPFSINNLATLSSAF